MEERKHYSVTCRLAGLNVKINALYPQFLNFCRGYETDSNDIDFEITTEPKDIIYERKKAKEIYPDSNYLDYCLEYTAIYRKIKEKAVKYNCFVFHSSAVMRGGEAYVFAAKSGTGKSTHAAIWRKVFGDSVTMINDDKPLVRLVDDKYMIYGTPWNGKHNLSTNISAPIKAICFLGQAPENEIYPINDVTERMARVYAQSFRPENKAALVNLLKLTTGLANSVPVYFMNCNMSDDAAYLSYNTMSTGVIPSRR